MPAHPQAAEAARTLSTFRRLQAQGGLPPTLADLSRALGYRHRDGARRLCLALVRAGYLSHIPGAHRPFRLTGDPDTANTGPQTREALVLATFQAAAEQGTPPPRVAELSAALGLRSADGARRLCLALVAQGHLRNTGERGHPFALATSPERPGERAAQEKKDLIPSQRQVFGVFQRLSHSQGRPPTLTEVSRALGRQAPHGVRRHCLALAKQGYLQHRPGARPAFWLPPGEPGIAPSPMQSGAGEALPLIGEVAAGRPMLAEAHIEDWYHLDPRLFRPRADFLLRARGHSMVNAGIRDRDLLAVHRTPEAQAGQIVVARLADVVTVKTLRREGEAIVLAPENPSYEPLRVTADQGEELAIEGIVVGVIRR